MGALANHWFEKDRDRLTARVAALSSQTLSFRQYCVRIWLNSGWIRSCIGGNVRHGSSLFTAVAPIQKEAILAIIWVNNRL